MKNKSNKHKNNFWECKSLTEMSREEWESLCDHCGKCCLLKLQNEDEQDDDAQSVYYTDIVCHLFNTENGHCTDYQNRQTRVPECLRLTQNNLQDIEWLPPSCAYRRIMEGRGLADWHHLVSGDKNTIHQSGHSVLGKVILENECNPDKDENFSYEDHIVEWPLE